MKKKVLITGGTGLLGKALIEASRGHDIVSIHSSSYKMANNAVIRYENMDVRDNTGLDNLFASFKPDVVIHTAGVGSPDYAEKHKEETWQINVQGTKNMLRNCECIGSKFIYISSNGIYDGKKARYAEEDEATPINFYGQVKLEGENIARSARVPWAIVRPILMYGWNHHFERNNVVTFAISRFREGKKVFAYDDVFVNPLFAGNCAKAIWKIVEDGKYDIFNIAGSDRINIYELAKKTAIIFGLDPGLAVPVQQGFFNELVKRPKDTSFDTEKMTRVLGLTPLSVDEGLSMMKKTERSNRVHV